MTWITKSKARKSKSDVRQHDPEKPPLQSDVKPPGASSNSPIPTGVEARAQRLIHAAGSVESAKTAVDSAAQCETLPDFREDLLAKRLGFDSRQELLDASDPISSPDGASWWATQLQGGQWVVWNNDSMAASVKFPSLDAAHHSLNPLKQD